MSAWPQYVVLVLLFVRLVAWIVKDHGLELDSSAERAAAVVASFAAFGILFSILWAGGFWGPLGW